MSLVLVVCAERSVTAHVHPVTCFQAIQALSGRRPVLANCVVSMCHLVVPAVLVVMSMYVWRVTVTSTPCVTPGLSAAPW